MKILKRFFCLHEYKQASSLEMGSFARGVFVCRKCGKRVFIEQIRDCDVIL